MQRNCFADHGNDADADDDYTNNETVCPTRLRMRYAYATDGDLWLGIFFSDPKSEMQI